MKILAPSLVTRWYLVSAEKTPVLLSLIPQSAPKFDRLPVFLSAWFVALEDWGEGECHRSMGLYDCENSPDSLGPLKYPPMIGMATRWPLGPFPISIIGASVQLSEYRYVSPGAAGVAFWANVQGAKADISGMR